MFRLQFNAKKTTTWFSFCRNQGWGFGNGNSEAIFLRLSPSIAVARNSSKITSSNVARPTLGRYYRNMDVNSLLGCSSFKCTGWKQAQDDSLQKTPLTYACHYINHFQPKAICGKFSNAWNVFLRPRETLETTKQWEQNFRRRHACALRLRKKRISADNFLLYKVRV